MNAIALISIDNLSQLIPALAAFKQQLAPGELLEEQPLYIFIKPHIQLNPLAFEYLQRFFNNKSKTQLINGSTLFKNNRLLLKIPVKLRTKFLFKHLAQYTINQLFFAHDCSSDFWNQTLMQAFPQAERICYGDALGLVYSQDFFTALMYPIFVNNRLNLFNLMSRFKRKLLLPGKKQQLYPSKLMLAIPCDPGQDAITPYSLEIVKKSTLLEVISHLSAYLPEIEKIGSELIDNPIKPTLLMLSNFTESRLTSVENEINLYRTILQHHANINAPVIIKPHPAADPNIFKQIVQALHQDFSIKVIDPELVHLPIELLQPLIRSCKVLSVSYSSISLPFLYDIKVIHALTPELILNYFQEEKMDWFMKSNDLYLAMINGLTHWNNTDPITLIPS